MELLCLMAVAMLCLPCIKGDVYLHNPSITSSRAARQKALLLDRSLKQRPARTKTMGSNNRLDEQGRERANGNRMFDSQNNNRGGYNVGSLYYYAGSKLAIEWTNQHSCGEKNSHCELILQYSCDNRLRDGILTTTIPERRDLCDGFDCNTDLKYGMHEDYDWYMNCKYRQRNDGLFTADQKLKGNTARYTRQNPGGTRRGYECPEERDYYPYWHPTQWKDIAIMTNDVSRCEHYQEESQNVKPKYWCVPPEGYIQFLINGKGPAFNRKPLPITKEECEKIVFPIGSNTTAKWMMTNSWELPPPQCIASPRSRDNHNGNGVGAFPVIFNWTLPELSHEHCALRLRYNISTLDYDGWSTNSSHNTDRQPSKIGIGSLVGLQNETMAVERGYVFQNNPVVKPLFSGSNNIIGNKLELQLAINTAQYGRVFQDRSHSFAIRPRPKELQDAKIHNLNVRGKRGNIVQVYPAVEYDFIPNRLHASVGDHVHIQWTGSNTNPGNNDGQGLAGSDRSNIVLLKPQNYPEGLLPSEQKYGHFGNNHPEHLNVVKFLGLPIDELKKLAILMPGQFLGALSELDDAGTYFDLQPHKITSPGIYYYMCSRNNNFSNRSQKGRIIITANKVEENVIGWSGGSVVLNDNEGVWVQKAALKQSIAIRVEEWSHTTGEQYIQSNGGDFNVGGSYNSKYFAVYPFEDIAERKEEITLKMKVNKAAGHIYHSVNFRNWKKVDDVTYDGNLATINTKQGGIYVSRTDDKSYNSLIIGVVIAIVFLSIIAIATIIYFKRRPEAYRNLRKTINDIKLGTKSQI